MAITLSFRTNRAAEATADLQVSGNKWYLVVGGQRVLEFTPRSGDTDTRFFMRRLTNVNPNVTGLKVLDDGRVAIMPRRRAG